jgi:uncharacterized protein YdcH (DUF465 family)
MTEPDINNFYLVQNRIPAKLIATKEGKFQFRNLFNNEIFKTDGNTFREIEITQAHFDKIGFESDSLNDVYVKPLYVILGKELLNLRVEFYGYLIFHKDELVETQKNYNSVLSEIYKLFDENPELLKKSNSEFRKNFNSVNYLNALFHRLEKYDINIENKEEIAVQ